ncbi:transporter substrate-binding domain-containing protein [Streptomyces sp. G44]|uniref:substrate-binding periplasmic protein n=1 Tax=Streptomyces sp. G44 TaxID=2807632 RepID=UPI0019601F63|nr:transporter substrate-binding domain-containing protein [Streptomyces sp. G44]MBM7167755.1 transporter substrate-binding domain-containing protein [Streptomyces sp. G44]
MGKAGRSREFHGSDAEQALARFLVDITKKAGFDTVAKLAERFPRGGSRSTWADYLNGKKLIPQRLLGEVLQEFRNQQADHWNSQLITRANRLWKDAANGTAPSDDASTELLSLHRRLSQTQDALVKAQAVTVDSERVIHLLLQFSSRQETRIAALTREVSHLRDIERARSAHHLDQARFRLSRIQAELDRARSDRYTAEQAQTVLLKEHREVLREIEALQRNVPVQDGSGNEAWTPAPLPVPAHGNPLSEEETDRDIDERLDLVHNRSEQREELLSQVLRQADMTSGTAQKGPRTVPGTLISKGTQESDASPLPGPTSPDAAAGLSRTTHDNTTTSENSASPRRRKSRRTAGLVAAALLTPLLLWGAYSAGPDSSSPNDSRSTNAPSSPNASSRLNDPSVTIGIAQERADRSDGQLGSGYERRVGAMAAKALGREPLFVQMTAESREALLQRRVVDFVMLAITPSRMRGFDVVGPYVRAPSALLTLTGSEPLTKKSDLDGKVVCSTESPFSQALVKTSGPELERKASVGDCVNALLDEGSDVATVLSDALTLYEYARVDSRLTVTGQSVIPGYENHGFVMRKGQRQECVLIKKSIMDYIDDMQWAEDISVLPQVFREDDWKKYRPTGEQINELSCRETPGR